MVRLGVGKQEVESIAYCLQRLHKVEVVDDPHHALAAIGVDREELLLERSHDAHR